MSRLENRERCHQNPESSLVSEVSFNDLQTAEQIADSVVRRLWKRKCCMRKKRKEGTVNWNIGKISEDLSAYESCFSLGNIVLRERELVLRTSFAYVNCHWSFHTYSMFQKILPYLINIGLPEIIID
jgi:hypothetical protein